MISIYILLLAISLYSISFCKNGFFDDYLGRSQTNSMKGVFIILVFIRHILQYIDDSGCTFCFLGDNYVKLIDSLTRQLLVAYFLFCSGYGIMEGIKSKGREYINSIPRKRVAITLINFDIAVFVFLIIDSFLDNRVTIQQFTASLICWDSIGNSNWYIFAILCCYLMAYLSFKILNYRYPKKYAISLITLLCIIYIIVLNNFKPSHWYNTILCFPLGLFVSANLQRLTTFLRTHYMSAFICLSVTFGILYVYDIDSFGITHNIYSMIFCLLIVMANMKLKIENSILIWLGTNLFPLYIYQRLPMMLLYSFNDGFIVKNYPIIYLYSCFIFTIIIAFLYKKFHFSKM